MQVKTGIVKRFLQAKEYGFIGRAEGRDLFFHIADTLGEIVPRAGDRVQFDIADTPKGPKAVGVRVVSNA